MTHFLSLFSSVWFRFLWGAGSVQGTALLCLPSLHTLPIPLFNFLRFSIAQPWQGDTGETSVTASWGGLGHEVMREWCKSNTTRKWEEKLGTPGLCPALRPESLVTCRSSGTSLGSPSVKREGGRPLCFPETRWGWVRDSPEPWLYLPGTCYTPGQC